MHDRSHAFSFPTSAAPSGGDGASAPTDAQVLLSHHQRKVRALVDNETGVRFESVALFAEPLFSLYDLDPMVAFELRAAPDSLPRSGGEADDVTVAVLETARVFWAYFSLPPSQRTERRADLAAFLLGPDATAEDEDDFAQLLDTVEAHWGALTRNDVSLAEDIDTETLDFDALLDHPAFAHPAPPASTERSYGADQLGEMEARALFAQPLLARHHDPDDLDAAMERADDYWTLAHLHGVERDAFLDELVDAIALDADEATEVRAEAEEMIARFQQIFPEHA